MDYNLPLILSFLCVLIHNVSSTSGFADPASINETVPKKFFNNPLQLQNPSPFNAPSTDNGGQPPFKYPFAFTRRAQYGGGWARELTVRDLPIATAMAGVQMRLVKGGVRQLHWHVTSEWAYMIYGKARITAVTGNGRAFVEDVQAGDLWFFPAGVPHSIQGIGKDGAFFLLVFNDGNFSTFDTFPLSDWIRHIPVDVLASNFNTSPSVFTNLTIKSEFIFKASLPQALSVEKTEVSERTGFVSESLAFFASKMTANVTRIGGEVKIIDKINFPVTANAAAIVRLKPGAIRELHWHTKSDEWQYYIEGQAAMSIFNGHEQARTMDFQAGDVGYVPISRGHYIKNTGSVDVVFLEVFATPYYDDISLSEWLAHTPSTLVNSHINTGVDFIKSINKIKSVIMP